MAKKAKTKSPKLTVVQSNGEQTTSAGRRREGENEAGKGPSGAPASKEDQQQDLRG